MGQTCSKADMTSAVVRKSRRPLWSARSYSSPKTKLAQRGVSNARSAIFFALQFLSPIQDFDTLQTVHLQCGQLQHKLASNPEG